MTRYIRTDNDGCFDPRVYTFEELQEWVIEEIEINADDQDIEKGKLKQKYIDDLQTEEQLIEWAEVWGFSITIQSD